ncbi:reverse transcriptase family protein [Nesterenkonia alkaliphila]|nr:reverse transcriptase family protein [Nesterenkonia alkaliphila]
MTILSDTLTLDDLVIAATLPDTARDLMEEPVRPWQLNTITVRKSPGKFRRVVEPRDNSLARVQKKLKEFLDRDVLEPHPCVHGFTRDRGPYTNALAHLNARAALTIDISDFFSSVSSDDVQSTLVSFGASTAVARGITNVSVFENVLATGFSTSPVLSNMYFRDTDDVLATFAEEFNLTYTRYADDLTFSGEDVDDTHLAEITRVLESKGLRVNQKKVRFQRSGHPQFVTGYVIAHRDHPRVGRYFKRQLRLDLHYVMKHGLVHQAQLRGLSPQVLAKQLAGRINYLMCSERDLAVHLRQKYGHLLDDVDENPY